MGGRRRLRHIWRSCRLLGSFNPAHPSRHRKWAMHLRVRGYTDLPHAEVRALASLEASSIVRCRIQQPVQVYDKITHLRIVNCLTRLAHPSLMR